VGNFAEELSGKWNQRATNQGNYHRKALYRRDQTPGGTSRKTSGAIPDSDSCLMVSQWVTVTVTNNLLKHKKSMFSSFAPGVSLQGL
jgi:hypothetical protein